MHLIYYQHQTLYFFLRSKIIFIHLEFYLMMKKIQITIHNYYTGMPISDWLISPLRETDGLHGMNCRIIFIGFSTKPYF